MKGMGRGKALTLATYLLTKDLLLKTSKFVVY
jgi:hypothetical protein